MKILMVISQFHPIIGGAEKQAELLAKKLVERGVSVNLITGWWKFGTRRKETIDGVNVFRNFCAWGTFAINNRVIRMFGGIIYAISLGAYLLLHKQEYDVIHVHQVLYPAFVSALVGKGILKKPVLAKNGCTGLTSDINCIRRFPFGGLQLKYLIKHLDYLIAVNEEGVSEFRAVGFPETKIQHIPNGVSLSTPERTKSNDFIYVISIVRLDVQKGIDVLLKAWAKVAAQERTARLLILGEGPLESELKNLAKSLEIMDSVKFVGLIKNPQDYLRKSDIFVLPSRAEGMSNALLEAMCIGLSCVATNISGNSELISENPKQPVLKGGFVVERKGILVNSDDAIGLGQAILYFIRNKTAAEEMGARARKFILENYSIDLVAERYIALYQSILAKGL